MHGLREEGSSAAGASRQDIAARLIEVLTDMLRELRGPEVPTPTLEDDLERTLGIDSLARMELMLRLERSCGLRVPEATAQEAQTLRDLLQALCTAVPLSGATGPNPAPPVPAAPDAKALPDHARTLLDVLEWHASRSAERTQVTLLRDEGPAGRLTHAALLERGRGVAAGLQRAGLAPGESVALMLPTSLAFFEAYTGILLAGGVPMPIYPPFRVSQIEDHLRRQTGILDNGRAVLLVTDPRALPAARILRAGVPALRAVVTVDRLLDDGAVYQPVARDANDIALLQYTSGSTGQPKGVVLTHANLLSNVRAMGRALEVGSSDVFVSWLPLYHDMGLIGAWMGSLYHGMPLVVMPPQAFLARPSRWLRALHEHRGTLSAAPNFAYEILASKVPDDELQGLDLGMWRVAGNGAEPIHPDTLTRFAERLRPHGFDAGAMMPMYGLAENGVGLAFPPLGRGPRIDAIDRRTLHAHGRAEPVSPVSDTQGDAVMQIVSCGWPLPGHEIRVVDAHGVELPERREGRIEFRGPSATPGYFRNPDATSALVRGDWRDTGDVGYIAQGELYLTSRVKDLIIRGGHNLHPYDLENAVARLPHIRKGCVAAFGARDPASATDRVVVVAETRLGNEGPRASLRQRIEQLCMDLLGVPADDIVLAAPGTVLKTSSGKVRRAACRELYEQGRLGAGGRSVAWQLVRLWADAWARRWREPLAWIAEWLYAGWVWALFGMGAVAAAVTAWLPSRPARKRVAQGLARLVVNASGLPLQVEGAYPKLSQVVVIANHASYVDWLVLAAVLPPQVSFVAKRELARAAPLRWVLSRMGTRFVERDDVHASVEGAKVLLEAVRSGESLVFFAEGTVSRAPGLQPFHMGAFVTAAQAGVAVVPVSLRGTRSVLREGSWRPRRHPVQVHMHMPLQAAGTQWRDAVALRDAARERIASTCGEPVLAG